MPQMQRRLTDHQHQRTALLEAHIRRTMDELMACAKAITENGNGEVFGYTDRGSADAATFMSPAGWIYAWGVNFLDEKYHPQLTKPEAIARDERRPWHSCEATLHGVRCSPGRG